MEGFMQKFGFIIIDLILFGLLIKFVSTLDMNNLMSQIIDIAKNMLL